MPGGCAQPAHWWRAPTYGYRGGGGGSGLNYLFCGGGNWGFGGPATYEVWLEGPCPEDFYLLQENGSLILQETGWNILIDY